MSGLLPARPSVRLAGVQTIPGIRCGLVAILAMLAPPESFAQDQPTTASASTPTRISASIVAPEVQDKLELSAEQRQKVADLNREEEESLARIREQTKDGGAAWSQSQEARARSLEQVRAILSSEQQARWLRLRWLEVATMLGPTAEITNNEVRAELKLSDRQLAAIDEIQARFCAACQRIMDEMPDTDVQPLGVMPRMNSPFLKKTFDLRREFEARLDTTLEESLRPEQLARWTEIQWQRLASSDGPRALLDPDAVTHLDLSESQQQQIRAIADETQRQVDSKQKERRYREGQRMRIDNLAKAIALLSPRQQELWRELLGKPFRDRMWRFQNPDADTAP